MQITDKARGAALAQCLGRSAVALLRGHGNVVSADRRDLPWPGQDLDRDGSVTFCMLTGDWHAIHADAEFAKSTRIGQRMFHGMFGIALAVSMSANLLTLRNPVIAALGIREWSFKAPLFINDTVHLELTVTEKKVTSDGRRAVLGRLLRLCKHDGSIAQEGFADLMVALEVA